MTYLLVLAAMVVVGLVIGYFADKIFKGERPKGLQGDLIASVVTCVAVSLMSWYIIPMMGFKQSMVYLSLATEPALGTLLVLWLIRRANR
jgi:uncharacterized membrane protein YeaQ/YmgE (transglycosylase-associated protein family)